MMTKHYCGQCNAYIRVDFCPACFERTNEPASSPLEPVVQGRAESPVPLSLDVQGTPDILAQLRARAMLEIISADRIMPKMRREGLYKAKQQTMGYRQACIDFLQWLDELGECQTNNTAPDTTSGIAGVP